MKITLIINGEEKTFTAPFISTRKLKKTLALSEKVNNGFSVETIDEIAEYIADIYGNQFTQNDVLDGFPGNEFFNKALEDMEAIIEGFNNKVKN